MRKFIFTVILTLFCINGAIGAEAQMEEKNNPFGVLEFLHWNHPWNNYKFPDKQSLEKTVKLMIEAGAGIVRMDFLWEDIEPQQGVLEFRKYDYIVELLNQNNIQILGLLNYSAPWASSYGKWNYPPQDNKLFVNYASEVITRYKGKVKYWEVWNEPDSNIYWTTQDGLKSYCLLLKDVYLAAKKIDPGCKILNGGLANGISSVNHLYDNGAMPYFDILSLHLFESPLDANRMNRAAAYLRLAYGVMQRNGDADKKIWITEIGSPGVPGDIKVDNWWLGKNPGEEEQARWLREIFKKLAGAKQVEKIFWAFFRDCDNHWNNGTDYFGLVRWDFSLKPAFYAYQECAKKYGAINDAQKKAGGK